MTDQNKTSAESSPPALSVVCSAALAEKLKEHEYCGKSGGLYLDFMPDGSIEFKCFARTHGGDRVHIMCFKSNTRHEPDGGKAAPKAL